MIGRTHAMIGMAAGLGLAAAVGVEPVLSLGLGLVAAVGSMVPDIDSPNSTISNKARPLRLFTFWIPHRTLTHSIFALLAISLSLAFGLFGLAFTAGYASHIAADMLTTRGIPFFYPFWGRDLHLLPYPLRITTGGMVESLLSVFLLFGLFGLLLLCFGVDVKSLIGLIF